MPYSPPLGSSLTNSQYTFAPLIRSVVNNIKDFQLSNNISGNLCNQKTSQSIYGRRRRVPTSFFSNTNLIASSSCLNGSTTEPLLPKSPAAFYMVGFF